MSLSQPSCSWMAELRALNPTGCFAPRFISKQLFASDAATRDPCSGPIVQQLFDATAGEDKLLQYGEGLYAEIKQRKEGRRLLWQQGGDAGVGCLRQAARAVRLREADPW